MWIKTVKEQELVKQLKEHEKQHTKEHRVVIALLAIIAALQTYGLVQ